MKYSLWSREYWLEEAKKYKEEAEIYEELGDDEAKKLAINHHNLALSKAALSPNSN